MMIKDARLINDIQHYGCLIDTEEKLINKSLVTIRYYVYNAKAYQIVMINGYFVTVSELVKLPDEIFKGDI